MSFGFDAAPRDGAMNITSPMLAGAAHIAELPGDSVTAQAEANDAFAIRYRLL